MTSENKRPKVGFCASSCVVDAMRPDIGYLNKATPELAPFYEALDPTNSFNPGIGKTSKQKRVHAHDGCC